ncbi:MAG: hypothetical protein ACR2QI_05260, partial [Woeseiaceae bacterium]
KVIEEQLSPTEQMVLEFFSIAERVGIDPSVFARAPTPIETFANQLQKAVSGVTQFNDPKGVYAHCFCEID